MRNSENIDHIVLENVRKLILILNIYDKFKIWVSLFTRNLSVKRVTRNVKELSF